MAEHEPHEAEDTDSDSTTLNPNEAVRPWISSRRS